MMPQAWERQEFFERLLDVGNRAYHHLHPFHIRMNEGTLKPQSICLWAANRYYYQRNLPMKDAAILSNCPLQEVRRKWVRRILDHDGQQGQEGGLEKWIRLAIGCGLTREETISEKHVLPGVRVAVDAYVNFAKVQPWPITIASSLTELFAPQLMSQRLDAFAKFYPWIAPDDLDYFRARLRQAKEDSDFALSTTLEYCTDRKMQEAAVEALRFKCIVLWLMLDALIIAGPID